MINAEALIRRFKLQAHPEGGFFCQTYRSEETIKKEGLPARFTGDRHISTAIYFLLDKGNFSAFHRIKSDECWHFYAGRPLLIYEIGPEAELKVTRLGSDIENGALYQHVVPAGVWFASEPAPGSDFSFVGCTVAPGFDFADFELAKAKELTAVYPAHENMIRRLCRQ